MELFTSRADSGSVGATSRTWSEPALTVRVMLHGPRRTRGSRSSPAQRPGNYDFQLDEVALK